MTWSAPAAVRATLDSLLDPYLILRAVRDEAGAIVDFVVDDANDASATYLAHATQDMIGHSALEVDPSLRETGAFAAFCRTVETGESLVLDAVPHRLLPTGERRFYDLRAVKHHDHLTVMFRDVTDRVVAVRRLAASEERFRLAMQRSAIGMCLISPDGRFLDVNDALCTMLDRTRDDLLVVTWQDLTHPDDLEADLALVDDIHAGRRDHYRLLKRYLRPDGTVLWGDLSVGCVRDARGAVETFISQIVDVTEITLARGAILQSEEHFRLLAENSSDVVYETDAAAVIRWISPSVERILGYAPAELIGRTGFDLVDPRHRRDADTPRDWAFAGRSSDRHFQCLRTKDGSSRWMSVEARPISGPDGRVQSAIVSLRDAHDEYTVNRAYDTLTAANEALLQIHEEQRLLREMCEIAVARGGYHFAWYGRRDDAEHSVTPVAASEVNRDYLDEVAVTWDDAPTGQGPTGRAIKSGITQVVEDFVTEVSFLPWRAAANRRGFRSSVSIPVRVDGEIDGAWMVYADEPRVFTPRAVALLEDLAGQLGYGVGRIRDAERLLASVRQRTLLATAIDQAAEAIMVTNPDRTIVYVNPATTESSGYTRDELLGANPRIFSSGLHDAAFYAAMWGELRAGRAWHGVVVNRRKDGELYEEDVTISPVTDDAGALVAYVGVKRDLTHERRLEAVLSQEQRDREGVAAIMDEIRPTETIEATAGALCAALCRLDLVDAAAVLLAHPSRGLVVVGVANTAHTPLLEVGTVAPIPGGEWLEHLRRQPAMFVDLYEDDSPAPRAFLSVAQQSGLLAVSGAPFGWDDRTVGLLVVGTATPEGRDALRRRGGLVGEVASFVGSLFGRRAAERQDEQEIRDTLEAILAGRRFHPEYQAIVSLADGWVQGYEALARFDDGTRPDVEFERARAVGLGSDLEAACARAAVDGARDLPAGLWLSINVSPAALLDGTAAAVAAETDRPLVIEITEHAAIESYADARAAVAACSGARLSVDDAGAGFASLRHILELAPSFVKLDIGLVRDIDRDPTRQALTAGLVHFATQTGITLIAEGIETEAEAQTLRVLGVRLGQGYLFGRPGPLG